MNVLLLSSDPVALDAVFCRLIHLPAAYVPTMRPGAESGLGTWSDDAIDILGDKVEELSCPDFKVVRRPAVEFDRSFPYYLKKWLTPRPVIDAALCRECGVCTEVCPLEPKAVRPLPGSRDKKPVYDYERCIRCYCCQEMCPHGAIAIRSPLLSRVHPPLSTAAGPGQSSFTASITEPSAEGVVTKPRRWKRASMRALSLPVWATTRFRPQWRAISRQYSVRTLPSPLFCHLSPTSTAYSTLS